MIINGLLENNQEKFAIAFGVPPLGRIKTSFDLRVLFFPQNLFLMHIFIVPQDRKIILTFLQITQSTRFRRHHTKWEVIIHYQHILLFKALRFLYASQEQNCLIVVTVSLSLTAILSLKYRTEKKRSPGCNNYIVYFPVVDDAG